MSRRIERVNSLIRQEMSQLLQREVKDPRLARFVTVTQVSTSLDLRHAKVLISTMGSDEEKKEVLEALTAASGFLRREISHRLRLRYTPQLTFCNDNSIDQASKVLQLIRQAGTAEAGEDEQGEC
ncbi:MAG: 30S ribosome-binding factor RbfA [Chloroflexi bacterium]|nr:30S ribosome-binding factor RbfA [Chloroflexota bacterium]